jgi:hypothetical protein
MEQNRKWLAPLGPFSARQVFEKWRGSYWT